MAKLTPKQQLFVEEYLKDLNATKAAVRAGYSEKSAGRFAIELLNKTHIANAVNEAKSKRAQRLVVDQDYVVKNLVEIVERCMQRAPVCDMKGNQIQDANGKDLWQFNSRDANKALDLLGKHLGMYQGLGTGRPKTHQEILERYRDGDLSAKEAAIEFEINNLPIPETIRILLSKEQPEPEDPTKGEYMVISDEEMEARVRERRAAIMEQIDTLPERQAAMRELRDQVADKFKAAPEKE